MSTTAPTTEVEPKRFIPRTFHGPILPETIDTIFERMDALLVGKTYTFVSCYEYAGWRPEARLHQRLNSLTLHKDSTHIVVSDTYGSWGLMHFPSRADRKQDLVTINDESMWVDFITPEGRRAHWLITVEGDIPEEGDRG